ncbi:MAG: FMN-binding protein [candidate division WOR-3 bacterium]|nr:FMN-binding protein [candidate division WOR-3 bacterium]
MKKRVRQVLVLFLVGIISPFLLSFVYRETKPVIERTKKEQLNKSLQEVFPDSLIRFETVKNDTLWRIYKNDSYVGIIYRSSKKGYTSVIRPIVSVDSRGKIIRLKIQKEGLSETPGLGMNVTEDWFQEQFRGLSEDELWLKKDREEGKLDAITSATISSRAVVSAVREGLKNFKKYIPGSSNTHNEWFRNALESLLGNSRMEVIIQGKLWKGGDRFIYLSQGEGFASMIGVLVSIRNDTIQEVHIQFPEEGFCETPGYGSKVIDEEFDKRFKGKAIQDIDGIDAISGATITSNAVKNAIKTGYKEFIQGGNR